VEKRVKNTVDKRQKREEKSKHKANHENTKGRRHERRGVAFHVSFFPEELLGLILYTVSCILASVFCSLTLSTEVSIMNSLAVAGVREDHERYTEP
jgi:hypothetical protein